MAGRHRMEKDRGRGTAVNEWTAGSVGRYHSNRRFISQTFTYESTTVGEKKGERKPEGRCPIGEERK